MNVDLLFVFTLVQTPFSTFKAKTKEDGRRPSSFVFAGALNEGLEGGAAMNDSLNGWDRGSPKRVNTSFGGSR